MAHSAHPHLTSRLRTLCGRRALPLLLLAVGAPALRAEEKPNFQDHIRPIFESACNNCHNPDKKKGGLDLTSFVATMSGGSSGEIVLPGAGSDSRLFKSVAKLEEPFMPPQGTPLDARQVELIRQWIDQGVLETAGGVARKPKRPAFEMQTSVTTGRPEGPPPMPEHLLLEPVVVTPRAHATAAIASSPWAPLVALSGQHQVLLYNTDTLELAGVLPFPEGFVESLHFSRNAQLLVGGGGHAGKSGRVVVWDVKSGRRVIELGEERDSVLGADITADHEVVALGGPSRLVKLFDTRSGESLKEIKKHTDWVTAVRFSPDGVLLASGDRAGNLHVWEAKSGNEFFTLPGHTAAITSLSWRGDSNVLASSSEDGTIRLWEMNEGKEVKKWDAHGGGVQSLEFTHDGRLVSCGRDNHVKVWDQNGAQKAAQNQFSDLPLAAEFTHDGQRFVVGDWSGKTTVWKTEDATAVGELSAAPPSIEQRLAALRPEVDKSAEAVQSAQDVLGAMSRDLTSAEQEVSRARQVLEGFTTRSAEVEATLARAREAAQSLLVRLTAPLPEPGASVSMDSGTARALSADLQQLTSGSRAALEPLSERVGGLSDDFSSLPARLGATQQLIRSKETEMETLRKKADEARAAVDSATAALQEQRQRLARWEAARVNAAIHSRRQELEQLAAEIEGLKAEAAARAGEAQELTAGLADAPEAERPGLAEKAAAARAAAEKINAELPALESRAASLQQEIERESQRYLSILPRRE